jgi:hypothetical protein
VRSKDILKNRVAFVAVRTKEVSNGMVQKKFQMEWYGLQTEINPTH